MVHDDAKVGDGIGQQYISLHQVHALDWRYPAQGQPEPAAFRLAHLVRPSVRPCHCPRCRSGLDRIARYKRVLVKTRPRIGRNPAGPDPDFPETANHDRVVPALFRDTRGFSSIQPLDSTTIAPTMPAGFAKENYTSTGAMSLKSLDRPAIPCSPAPNERVPSKQMNVRIDDLECLSMLAD